FRPRPILPPMPVAVQQVRRSRRRPEPLAIESLEQSHAPQLRPGAALPRLSRPLTRTRGRRPPLEDQLRSREYRQGTPYPLRPHSLVGTRVRRLSHLDWPESSVEPHLDPVSPLD